MNTRTVFTASVTATLTALIFAATAAVVPSAYAQDKMGKMSDGKMMDNKMSKMGKMSDGKMMKSPVYVSKMTKMYYSASDAKMMKMMDSKGQKLVKMEKAPTGYKMGKMASSKMDSKMSGGKMSDKKMEKM